MKRLKEVVICLLIIILCAVNIIQPVWASAGTGVLQTEPVESELIETELLELTDEESTKETESIGETEGETESERESETTALSEPESTFKAENENKETGETEVSEVCKVSMKFFGKGRILMTDGEGNFYEENPDTLDRAFVVEKDTYLTYEITPEEGYETERMDIYKGGALKDSVRSRGTEEKITGEIQVDSEVLLEIHFTELAKETEADEVITEETGIYGESEPKSETEIPRSSESGFTEETEKQNEENQSFEPFETDGNLSFLEGIKAEKLVQELEEEVMPMTSGNTGQVWGMYKIYTKEDVIIDEFLPGFKSNDYSKIIQTGPTLSENTMTAYCIQYGIACPAGGHLTEADLTVSQKNWIGYALEFGWRQKGDVYDEAQYSDDIGRTEYAVTQAVIWACSQNKFGTDAGEAAIHKVIQNSFHPDHGETYYNQLKEQIFNAERIPSFASRNPESAPEIRLKWNRSNQRYEALVSDTNGVLSRYNYTYPGISISRDGNTAFIYTTGNYPAGVTASAVYTTPGGENAVVLWDGESGNQDIATYQQMSTEIYSYIRIATEDVGNIELYKKSENPELTDGNESYDLSGAVYGVYDDSNTEVGRITTDSHGYGKSGEIPAGNYWVKEVTAPKGYAIDVKSYHVTVNGGQTATLEVTDYPQGNPVEILLKKTDGQTNEDRPSGSASLEGACFTVRYYTVQMDRDPAAEGHLPERTWVLKTDSHGVCRMEDGFKVSGDAFYRSCDQVILPLGTVTLQETEAPKGYRINEKVYVCPVTAEGDGTVVETYNVPLISEQVVRGDFEFYKNSEDGKAMGGIPFKISSKTTGENYTVYSDDKGYVTTKGLWFGGGTPETSLGGLPYDTYIVEEIACAENEDKILIRPFEVAITSHQVTENLGIIKNEYLPFPELDSVALGRETGDHTLPAESLVGIHESVECRNLIPGVPFSLRVKAVDPESGAVYMVDGKELSHLISFVPSEETETKSFVFEFSAAGMAGKSVTITGELLRRGKVVAAHNQNLDDADQTITVTAMTIDTAAADAADGDKILNFGEDTARMTVMDEIVYEGFIPGRRYNVVTELVETVTGSPVTNEGIPVSCETEFIPEMKNGRFPVDISLDVRGYENKQMTVFQTVYDSEGRVIAEHKALDDRDQTLEVRKIRIETSASDKADGDKNLVSEGEVIILDSVSYENLIPGRTYTVEGILIDKSTGKEFMTDGKTVTGKAVFMPETANGRVDVQFVFNASGLGNRAVVVFERLFNAEGALIAVHEDIHDKEQTVNFEMPAKPEIPETGDGRPVIWILGIGGVSLVVLLALGFCLGKKKPR